MLILRQLSPRFLFLMVLCCLVHGISWGTWNASAFAQGGTGPVAADSSSESAPAAVQRSPHADLASGVEPLRALLSGKLQQFQLEANLVLPIDSKPQNVSLELVRWDQHSFRLRATHPDYEVEIARDADATTFVLPKHRVVFRGSGAVDGEDHLGCQDFLDRIIGPGCQLEPYLATLVNATPEQLEQVLSQLVDVALSEQPKSAEAQSYLVDKKYHLTIKSTEQQHQYRVMADDLKVDLVLNHQTPEKEIGSVDAKWPEYEVRELERAELERHLARGARRGLEVLLPSNQLKNPAQIPKQVDGGELRYVDGQRLVILSGTPEEIGTAHGKLLARQAQRCIDSVLYGFGTVQTIVTGRWFRNDLEDAYQRLKPHIPESHIAETRALAQAMGQDPDVLETLNVFPELFHCSGFSVSGSATVDGKLYHGRVLDYMTTIGLQDCATTFIVHVDGKIPFANIGYAGFTGSVSGMNVRGISLGEMGGRGEGQWDGVPMATLMRRALEECDSLDEVVKLWATSPRTCEYYYVFADGKSNQAVGVAATPQSIQFVKPGESHELLGDGIRDCIALSAGSRLETLRQRISEQHGKIDVNAAIELMSRPVAMQSNLHNVLFVPEDQVFYVANADHDRPAAECEYVRYDLRQLLQEVQASGAADRK